MLSIANNLNIPLIDIHEEFFIKQPDPIWFFAHRNYGHYSPDGYNAISKIILNIEQNTQRVIIKSIKISKIF